MPAPAEGHHHRPAVPLWDLMMKNVYSLGAFQVNRENFRLDLVYNNPTTGVDINYIPRRRSTQSPATGAGPGSPGPQNAPNPDGVVRLPVMARPPRWHHQHARTARLLHRAGTLRSYLGERYPRQSQQSETVISTIAIHQLYDSTKTAAQNLPELNRFRLKGATRAPAAT
jgi:hypothetical protein